MTSLMSKEMLSTVLTVIFLAQLGLSLYEDLDASNFDDFVGKGQAALVEFYAPWCGHCKQLAPEYERLGKAFEKNKNVLIAKVDADAHSELGSRFGVTGFPTLKWFPKGSLEPEDYTGPRDAEGIAEFVNQKAGTSIKLNTDGPVTVLTDINFDNIVKDTSKHVLVEFYAPWCGHCKRLAPDYDILAESYAGQIDVVIAKIDADKYKNSASAYEVTGYPTLIWFPKENKDGVRYTEGRTPEAFVEFINAETGAERTVGGGVTEKAGLIEEFEELVKEFMEAKDGKVVLDKAVALKESYSGHNAKFAKFYMIAMKKIIEKGTKYIETEAERLDKLASSSSVSKQKSLEFMVRKNILSSFSSAKL